MFKVHTIQGLNAGAVLADPAWSFAVRSPKGEGRSASQHYACMTLEAIAALPVTEWAARRLLAVPVGNDSDAAAGIARHERVGLHVLGLGLLLGEAE